METSESTSIDLLFGYGSLIWRPSFPFVSRTPTYVRGFTRRFWQTSDDHRGTCERPGIVCCVLPVAESSKFEESSNAAQSCVNGVVFQLPRGRRDEILAEIDQREKNGYVRTVTQVYDNNTNECLGNAYIYVCDTRNPGFKPEPDPVKIAQQISIAVGPSGRNAEYILKLWQYLVQHKLIDSHVEAVVQKLLPLLSDAKLN